MFETVKNRRNDVNVGVGNIQITCTLGIVESMSEMSPPSGFQWDASGVASSAAQELKLTFFWAFSDSSISMWFFLVPLSRGKDCARTSCFTWWPYKQIFLLFQGSTVDLVTRSCFFTAWCEHGSHPPLIFQPLGFPLTHGVEQTQPLYYHILVRFYNFHMFQCPNLF